MTTVIDEKTKEAARLARNQYMREWRRKNPEKARAIAERHWIRKGLALCAVSQEE